MALIQPLIYSRVIADGIKPRRNFGGIMFVERNCSRCGGTEFEIIRGVSHSRGTGTERDVWFCPKCDWGSSHTENEPGA